METENPIKETERFEIGLNDILFVISKHKVLIAILSLCGALVLFTKTYFFKPYTYTSSGILCVSSRNYNDNTDGTSYIQKSDVDASRTITSTYIEILKTRTFISEVIEASGLSYSRKELLAAIDISSLGETELLKISVTLDNADDAYKIAKTIFEKAPGKLLGIYKKGEIEVVDAPIRASSPNGRGVMKMTVLGFMVGFVVGCGIAFVGFITDKRIHKTEDIEKRYNIPVIGELT